MSEQSRKSPEVPPEVGPEVPGSRLLTMPEVAELLGVSERAARDWVKRHDLPTLGTRPVRLAEKVVRVTMAVEGRDPRNSPEGAPEVFGRSPEVPGSGDPIEAAYQVAGEAPPGVALVPLQTMVEELRGLADQLAELARRNEGLALEVGTLRERVAGHEGQLAAKDEALAAKDETIDALSRRAELAEERASNELAERSALVAAKNQTIAEVQHRADLAEQEAAALRVQAVPPAVAQDATAGADSTTEASAPPAPAEGLWARLGRWWRGGDRP